jgi:hypothetical protein
MGSSVSAPKLNAGDNGWRARMFRANLGPFMMEPGDSLFQKLFREVCDVESAAN